VIKLIEEYIEILKPFVLELFKKDSSGHDITHLERTMNTAIYLSNKEGGETTLIGVAAFLHDIHRIMENETGKFVSPKESLPKVREILTHISLTIEEVNKICYMIEYHEEYNWNNSNVSDLNTLILQDADNLDAIGAIGIGRTFSYGGSHNYKMYDSTRPIDETNTFQEESNSDDSTIHHFYHKLFKLGEFMNTKTASSLALKRTEFMKLFVKEFLDEWNAKY